MAQIRANGLDFEYESFGRESDPAVLLIAGVLEQSTGWHMSFCEGLVARGFRVIRFDNRDVGKSTVLASLGAPAIPQIMARLMSGQKVDVPYTLRDMAADAAALLDALGIAEAHVVGRSMGGAIAQLVAIDYPGKTKSLVSMMSGSARRGLPPPKPEAVMAMMARPADDSREARLAVRTKFFRTVQGAAYPAGDDELRAYAGAQIDRAPLDMAAAVRQSAALIAAEPRNELLKNVRAPTLVLHGADDPLAPLAGAKDVADCVSGAELVVVPGMGHDFSEAVVKDVFLKYVPDFLLRVEAQARAA